MKNLTTSQKCTILASLFWIIISFFLSYKQHRHNEYFEPRKYLTLIIPIILYYSGVWVLGFGYIINFFKNIKTKLKKQIKEKNKNTKSKGIKFGEKIIFWIWLIVGLIVSMFYPDARFKSIAGLIFNIIAIIFYIFPHFSMLIFVVLTQPILRVITKRYPSILIKGHRVGIITIIITILIFILINIFLWK